MINLFNPKKAENFLCFFLFHATLKRIGSKIEYY